MVRAAPLNPIGALPIVRSRLIGREEEIVTGRSFLLDDAVSLLTVTGPGGVGKTRLGIAIAEHALAAFADGAVWVDLTPLVDPVLMPATIAAALDLAPLPDTPAREMIARYLRSRQTLLVLDNCEHLLEAVADLVAFLLASCPALQVLATSRAPLRIHGEQLLPLDPLPLPPLAVPAPSELAQFPAVRLFLVRARSARPSFALGEGNAASVAEICRRLDGLPLAIELAAPRVALFSPEFLLAQMRERVSFHADGPRDLPARQRTIGATIAWSYDLLSAEDQVALRRLAVFAGGWTGDAAAAVVGLEREEAMRSLERLVEQSLIRVVVGGAEPRFTLLETIRAFCLERLQDHGEEATTRDRHAAYFQELTARAEPDLEIGRFSTGWFTRLDDERDNVRAALTWSLQQGFAEQALRIAGSMAEYWAFRSDFQEGRAWYERALALDDTATSAQARCGAQYGVSILARFLGESAAALAAAQQLMCIAEGGEDRRDLVRAHFALAFVRHDGWREFAEHHACMAITLGREIGASGWVAWTLVQLDGSPLDAHAEAAAAEALALFRDLGSEWGQCNALTLLAVIATTHRHVSQAAGLYQEALALRQTTDDRWGTVNILIGAAALAAESGAWEDAAQLLAASLTWARELNYDIVSSNVTLSPFDLAGHLQQQLGPETFAAEWRRGVATPPQEAILIAELLLSSLAGEAPDMVSLSYPMSHPPAPRLRSGAASEAAPLPLLLPEVPQAAVDLTRREGEVLALLCQRLTDVEIGERLFISPYTASKHVSNLLGKLGVANRREAAALAARHGLAGSLASSSGPAM